MANTSENKKIGRTAIEVMGEEMFKQMELPEEVRNMELSDALKLGKQQLVRNEFGIPKEATQDMTPEDMLKVVGNLQVLAAEDQITNPQFWKDANANGFDSALAPVIRDKFGIPKDATKDMTPEDMLKVVGNLQVFAAEDQITNPQFWKDANANGFDSAMGPIIRDQLGVPHDVLKGAPASKVLKDAGELQTLGLEFGDANNWKLIDDFHNGKITGGQFVDRINGPKAGNRNSSVGSAGSVNSGNGSQGSGQPLPGIEGPDSPGLDGMPSVGRNSEEQKSSGNDLGSQSNSPKQEGPAGTRPGSAAGNTSPPNTGSESRGAPSSGAGGSGGTAGNTGGAGSNNGQQDSGGLGGATTSNDSDEDGFKVEGGFSGSYVVVTHNADGSFTARVIESDGNGHSSVIQTETYTDSNGDGTYQGDKGGESESKPNQGIYEGNETDEGTTYNYESDSSSTDSSDSSSGSDDGSTDSADDDDADVDTKDVDEYTPDPESGNMADLYNNVELMKSLYQSLSEEKFALGKGGKDSTPNPMSETMSGKKYPVDYKSMISRPVDGSSTSPTGNVQELIGQIQDPNAIQGGVIDPKKD